MSEKSKIQSRKRFIGFGLAAAAVIGTFRLFKPLAKKEVKPKTIRLLSQDGTLVEVDNLQVLCMKREKVSDDELKQWVHKNN
jgi:hypothetical protein